MAFSDTINATFGDFVKKIAFLFFALNIGIAHASAITVRVQDSDVFNWDPIQRVSPGFGSRGPISLNWDPNEDYFTELLAYDKGYSGGAGAFCWYGENCALKLSVTEKNTLLELKSFSLGYFGYGNNVRFSVIDLASDRRVLGGSPWIDGRISSLIDVDASSEKGFLILFGPDGFNGGINNISYSYRSLTNPDIVATPIPGAVVLFSSALVGLMFFNRKNAFSPRPA